MRSATQKMLLAILTAAPMLAQQVTGTIGGSVSDPSGAPAAGASVAAV